MKHCAHDWQVHAVATEWARGLGLKIGLLAGQSSLAAERQTVMGRPQPHHTTFYARGFTGADAFGHRTPRGRHGAVDVVVATPGRLIDHLENTPDFTLEHLR